MDRHTTQTRLVPFDDDRLGYATPEAVDPMDGRLCMDRVEFTRASPA